MDPRSTEHSKYEKCGGKTVLAHSVFPRVEVGTSWCAAGVCGRWYRACTQIRWRQAQNTGCERTRGKCTTSSTRTRVCCLFRVFGCCLFVCCLVSCLLFGNCHVFACSPIRNRPLGMDKRRCAQFSQWNAECVQLLRVLGVPVVELSLGEGEAKCAQLNEQGIVHACVTSDSDGLFVCMFVVYRCVCCCFVVIVFDRCLLAFLFGARQVIKSLDCTSETIVSVSAAEIDKRLGLRRFVFVECLLSPVF